MINFVRHQLSLRIPQQSVSHLLVHCHKTELNLSLRLYTFFMLKSMKLSEILNAFISITRPVKGTG